MSTQKEQHQTSFYLVRRAESLNGALKYFLASPDTARLIQFVAQSDFWEWELDNLLFSFTHFAERQAVWNSPVETRAKLAKLGIILHPKVARLSRYQSRRRPADIRRVAPVDLLRETLATWNLVLDRAESAIFDPMKSDAERWNIDTKTSLLHLRKQMPTDDILNVIAE